jgi:hypothetical protein
LFINLTPLIPLSMIWIYIPIMRGNWFVREASPLFDSPYPRVEDKGVLEGRSPSKQIILPFPLISLLRRLALCEERGKRA